jgi:hypothetical protein
MKALRSTCAFARENIVAANDTATPSALPIRLATPSHPSPGPRSPEISPATASPTPRPSAPLIRGLDYGEMDKLNTSLAGRAPVVSPQAASEYLAGGDAGRLVDFLASNGGRIGSQVSDEGAAALRSRAKSLTDQFGNARALGVGDSYVVGSAMQTASR